MSLEVAMISTDTAVLVAAYAILGIAPWPLYRLISIPPFRREYFCVAVRVFLIITLYFLGIGAIAIFSPRFILPLAGIAAIVLVAERWRARGNFGRSKGLPPGSLSLVPRGPWVDDGFYAEQAKKFGPVFKLSQYFRPMICVMGPREGHSLIRQHGDKLIAPPMRYSDFIPNGFLRFMEAPVHAKYRPVFRNAFGRPTIQDCMPFLEDILQADIAKMAALSRSSSGNGINPVPHVSEIMFRLVVRLFIGVDEHSQDFKRLHKLYEKVVIGKASCTSRSDDIEAINVIEGIISGLADRSRADLPMCFLAKIVQQNDDAVPDRTVLLNLVYMMKIASSDLAGLMTWAIKFLIDNPQWAERLSDATDRSAIEGKKLASLILKETLRLERSEYIFRKTLEAIDYGGFTIPRNWLVRICIRDGHRDADTFVDPHVFNPERFLNRSFKREEYSPLGIGAHSCVGGQVIDALGSAFLIEWAHSYRVEKHCDGPREYGRSHWQPSSALRIALIQR
jgi:cytochrome P450